MWKGPLVCWRNAFANIPCWILYAPVDVRSVFGLSVMHPVRVLIVWYMYMFVCCPSLIRRHFARWTEAVRCIFVTCTFQPFHVRCMYVRSFGFSTGLTFLQPDNKNSYPFHVRKFNPVKCDRGLKFVCIRFWRISCNVINKRRIDLNKYPCMYVSDLINQYFKKLNKTVWWKLTQFHHLLAWFCILARLLKRSYWRDNAVIILRYAVLRHNGLWRVIHTLLWAQCEKNLRIWNL